MNLSSSAQLALNPLTSGMSFSLGGSSGLKGLPGSLTSGDSGWQQTIETVITTYQKGKNGNCNGRSSWCKIWRIRDTR